LHRRKRDNKLKKSALKLAYGSIDRNQTGGEVIALVIGDQIQLLRRAWRFGASKFCRSTVKNLGNIPLLAYAKVIADGKEEKSGNNSFSAQHWQILPSCCRKLYPSCSDCIALK